VYNLLCGRCKHLVESEAKSVYRRSWRNALDVVAEQMAEDGRLCDRCNAIYDSMRIADELDDEDGIVDS